MPFEKMTAGELYDKFVNVFWKVTYDFLGSCKKIGARAIKIETKSGKPLYFIWYDDDNWTIGTKMYRKKPEKQVHKDSHEKRAL